MDLLRSRSFWEGWFKDMNGACLGVFAPKLLIMAGPDRLDNQMNYAWHQGKIKHRIILKVGHSVQEDSPEEFVKEVRVFVSMFRLV